MPKAAYLIMSAYAIMGLAGCTAEVHPVTPHEARVERHEEHKEERHERHEEEHEHGY